MITNAADYEFVTGITNGEVLIDGGIMPARDVAVETSSNVPPLMQPRCLRGEDMAFLAECAGERNTVMEQQQAQAHAYTRSITAAQIDSIQSDLTRYIRPPNGGNDNLYVTPDYQFGQHRINAYAQSEADPNLTAYNWFTEVYPDAVYKTPASENPNPLVANDVRAMFYDAQMTRRPVPTGNFWGAVTWPYKPGADYNVRIVSDTQRKVHESNWTAPGETSNPADFIDSAVLYWYSGNGYQAGTTYSPSRFYVYTRKPSSFQMTITIPQEIRDYVENELTVMLFVFSNTSVAKYNASNINYDYKYVRDMWGFPLEKTANANGQVTVTLADVAGIQDAIQQDFTSRGYNEFQWYGSPQKFVFFRGIVIMGCPLICKLKDHTDFSSLDWQWTP